MAKSEATFLIKAKDGTKSAFRSANRGLEKLRKVTISTQTAVLGLVGTAGLSALVKTSIDAGDKINKLSARLGASTEALSQYQHVAEISGVTFETLTMGWQRMTRRVAEAAQGTGEAVGALRELGLSAEALNQLKPEQQFEIIADALRRVDNQADKVRLSMKLFDSEGVSLLQTMEDGAAGIREMRNEADQLGKTLSKADADAISKAKDSMTRMSAAVSSAGQAFAVTFGPAITSAVEFIRTKAIPAFSLLFERLGLIKRSINSLAEEEVLARMALLREKMKELSDQARASAPLSPFAGDELAKLQKMGAEYAALEARLEGINETQQNILTGNTGAAVVGDVTNTEEDPEIVKARDRFAAKFYLLEESLLMENERMTLAHENRQFMIEEAFNNELITNERRVQLLEELELRHQAKMGKIEAKGLIARRKFHQMTTMEQVKTQLEAGVMMTQGVATTSKTLFEINKALSLAKVAVNLPSAVIESFNNGGGYPWGLIPAGLMLATGLAQLNAIKNARFESGAVAPSLAGSGGGSTTVGTVPVGGANTQTPTLPQSAQQQEQEPTVVRNYYLSGTYTSEQVRDLMEDMNDETSKGRVRLSAQVA